MNFWMNIMLMAWRQGRKSSNRQTPTFRLQTNAALKPPLRLAAWNFSGAWRLVLGASFALVLASTVAAADLTTADFRKDIQPVLQEFCYDCHGDGAKKGGVALDELNPTNNFAGERDVWWRVLKNLRAGLMPPVKKSQPTPEQKELIQHWIKDAVFELDPLNPDPGRVTLRRLNRVEYQNTIRDLLGVEFEAVKDFPPDDTGHGFDNNGDVLTMSPMLLEKYLVAAEQIISRAVPVTGGVAPERVVPGWEFRDGTDRENPTSLSYYQSAAVTNVFEAPHAGQYQLNVNLQVNEKYVDDVFDLNKCEFIFRADGQELLKKEFAWEGGKPYHFSYDQTWTAGKHQLDFELRPLTPGLAQGRTLSMQIVDVTVRGPLEKEHRVKPENYARFFPKEVPAEAAARRDYARELLAAFARRAFRRPVDDATNDRLLKLAESVYHQPGKTFESGVAQAMVAVLASPRFIFREESREPLESKSGGQAYALVDEYALASRLSYFFWSSMPDQDLFAQAAAGTLRKNLSAQVARMLTDGRARALEKNFIGQWLQARDIDTVPIEARSVLAREQKFDPQFDAAQKRFRELNNRAEDKLTKEEKAELAGIRANFRARRQGQPRAELTGELRRAMRQETENVFAYIVREDRSLLELLDSDYTFLNERLAQHYGIPDVTGQKMRRVTLPADSPRGGILTQGAVLAITSNPTRTSPVKRGVFILDNILGTPPLPPPPNIPPLEDANLKLTNRAPTLRETLAAHRENALCASCHNQMDPLGLALENFNAMGMWRDQEFNQPIDVSGKLVTGENFANVRELKQILVKNHAGDFYRTLTEKLLTYALGRGLDYYDVATVDQIVARVEKSGGKPSALLAGIVESAPFQKTRVAGQASNARDANVKGKL
jgi:mono/diheme cytochrome c family protein